MKKFLLLIVLTLSINNVFSQGNNPSLTATDVGDFDNVCVNTTSNYRTFILNGSKLTANVIVKAEAGFAYSTTSGSGYTGPNVDLIITPQSGNRLTDYPVYVKFTPTSVASYSGKIQITTSGANTAFSDYQGNGITIPLAATDPYPANNATDQCYQGGATINKLEWVSSETATSYNVYFGADSLPVTYTNVTGTSYTLPSSLNPNTTYHWKVVPVNDCGVAQNIPEWQFTTAANPCAAVICDFVGFNRVNPITNVSYAAINNSSSDASHPNGLPYEDFTSISTTVFQTSNNLITVKGNTAGNNTLYFIVFIDWNNDGVFSTGESVNIGSITNSTGLDTKTASINIITPPNAALASVRMRVIASRNGYNSDPCQVNDQGQGSQYFGQTEDYTINVCALPVASCKNIEIELDANGNASIVPNDIDNGSTANCGGLSISISKSSFNCSNIGDNYVDLTVTDSFGNTKKCTATVTVKDNIAPTITCPSDLTVSCEVDTSVAAIGNATSSDNCDTSPTLSSSDAITLGSCSGNYLITRTWTSTDESGNVNSCEQLITVVDTTPPSITCPTNIVANTDANSCEAIITYNVAYSDNCGIATFVQTAGLASGSAFPVGTTTNTFEVTDACGLTNTCSFDVTIEDNEAPIALCQDLTIQLDASGNASITASTEELANSSSEFSGTQGQNNWTYGQYFAFSPQDWQLPNWNGFVWADYQSFATPFLDANGGHPGVDDLKWAVRRWTSDFSGDVAISGDFYDRNTGCGDGAHVRIFQNNTQVYEYLNIPGSSVPYSINLNVSIGDKIDFIIDPKFDAGCDDTHFAAVIKSASGIDNGSNDACGIQSISLSQTDFDCSHVGANIVTLTVTDNNGNVSTCTATVTVEDHVAPITLCQDITIQLDAAGAASIVPADIDGGSSDACGFTLAASKTTFDCSNVGANTVTLTVTDANGNATTCDATVTVVKAADLVASAPANVSLTSCATAQNISDAYDTWKAGFTVSGGYSPTDNLASFPALMDLTCGGQLSFTLIADNLAGYCEDHSEASSTFTVGTAADLVASAPADPNLAACTSEADILTAYNAWKVGFTVVGGCSPTDNMATFPALTDLTCGGQLSFTLTANNIAGGCVDTSSASSTFTVGTPDAVVLIAPTNTTIEYHGTEDLQALYDAWLATAQYSGGCELNVENDAPATHPGGECNETYTVTWSATSRCDTKSVSATFTVLDKEIPNAVCKNITVALDGNGSASIVATDIDGGSTDNCGIASITASKTTFDCDDVTPKNTLINKVVISQIYGGGGNSGATYKNDFIELFNSGNTTVNLNGWSLQYAAAAGKSWSVTPLTGSIQSGQYYLIQQAAGTASGTFSPLPTPDAIGTIAMSALAGKVVLLNNATQLPSGESGVSCPTGSQIIDFVGYGITANCFEGIGATSAPSNTNAIKRNSSGCQDSNSNSADFTIGVPTPRNSASPMSPCSSVAPGIPVTLTVTDINGNVNQCTSYVIVEDKVAPTIGVAASDLTVECDGSGNAQALNDWLALNGGAEASDACGIVWSNNFIALSDGCGNTGSATVIFTVTDPSGNTATTTATFTIEDTTAPDLTVPANVTINCEDDKTSANTGVATATDTCSNFNITQSDVSTQIMDNTNLGYYNYTITRTWTAVDECNNSVSIDQIITVQDVTPPTITDVADVTVNCEDDTTSAATGVATGSDNCSPVAITQSDVSTQNNDPNTAGHYNYMITRTWRATDVMGLFTESTQIITVQDVTPPTITDVADVTVNCEDDTTSAATGVATGSDNCSPVAITQSDVSTQNNDPNTAGHYNYTITRTWRATDVTGLFTESTQIITVQDVTPPTITDVADVTVNCEDDTTSAATGVATGSDNCSPVAITQSDVSTQNNDPNTAGHYNYTITRTWRATDVTGLFTESTQIITVQDVTPPTITDVADVTVNCEDDTTSAATGVATGSDNCSPVAITQSDVSTQNNDPNTAGHYNYTITRTWRATDVTGLFTESTQIITVQDVTPPTITDVADVTVNCEDNTTSAATGVATGSDNCSPVAITQSDVSTQNNDPNTAGHYNYTITRTWRATDVTGLFTESTQIITVQDVTPPTITDVADVTVNCEDDTTSAATGVATGSDNCSPVAITQSDVSTQNNDPNTAGHYNYTITRTWRATDVTGLFTESTQIITVQDVTPPTITDVADVTVNCEDDTTSAATGVATGSDNCSPVAITQSDVSTQNNDPNTAGHYNYTITRTWRATDVTGLFTESTQIITVQDVTPPTITDVADVTVNCEDDTTSAATGVATGSDNCSPVAITQSDVSTQNNDPNTAGHYNYTITRTWRATDVTGLFTESTQIITVQDVTPPTITDVADVTVNCEDDTTSAATGVATGSDNCSPVAITQSDVSTQNNDPNTAGHYNYTITRTWRATDVTGLFTESTQIITVQDVTPPTITDVADVTVNCEDDTTSAATGVATGSDDCSAVAITQSDVSTQNNDPNNAGHYNYTITRTWRATDVTRLFTESTQTITVQDVTPPEVDCVALQTIFLDSSGNATITAEDLDNNSFDNCSPVFLAISQEDFNCSDIGGDLDELLISEYVNGSDDNKAIEIFNGTGLSVNMSEYILRIYPNGGGAPFNIQLLGTVVDKDVFVVGHTFASNSGITTKRDYAVSNLDFDGDDAIELLHNGVPVDYIPGGSGWVNTLVRNDNIQSGSASGDLNEWTAYSLDTFTYLGSHDITVVDKGNNVLLTVTDVSGNSSTCEAKVFVQDVTKPDVVCNAITIQLDATGNYVLTTADKIAIGLGSDDACGIASYQVSPNVFDCTNVGPNQVTLTVTDKNGNSDTCTTTITVEDKVNPIALCKPITIQLDANGNASIVPADIDGGSSDACGFTLSASQTVFDCSNVGVNTVTLTVTDANGNTAECDATVTVEDNVDPTAICKDITVYLGADGTVTIAEDAVNNGSNDACGGLTYDTDITSFTCAEVKNPVSVMLTVTDANGNSSSCSATVTVIGIIPDVSISQGPLPEFCQGAFEVLSVQLGSGQTEDDIRSYAWSYTGVDAGFPIGEPTNENSIRVKGNGIYTVDVTSETNCTTTVSYTVTGFDATALISSYTILAKNEVFLHGSNIVQTGGVGATEPNTGTIKLHQASTIVGFGKAPLFNLNQGSTINGGTFNQPANPVIPPFQFNTVSNASSPNVVVTTNTTLSGAIYGTVEVRDGATVTFSQSNIYINNLKTFQGAKIEFTGCANVYINEKFMLAQNGVINSGGENVVFYVNEDVQIEKGSNVRARMHLNGHELLAKGEAGNKNKAPEPTYMTGLFIANRVHGSINVVWNADDVCSPCPIEVPASSSAARPEPSIDSLDEFAVASWPNPSKANFSLKVKTLDRTNRIQIQVYDMSNKLVYTKQFNPDDEYRFGNELEAGVYMVKISQGGKVKTVRLVKY